jgi:hypothetical protein
MSHAAACDNFVIYEELRIMDNVNDQKPALPLVLAAIISATAVTAASTTPTQAADFSVMSMQVISMFHGGMKCF